MPNLLTEPPAIGSIVYAKPGELQPSDNLAEVNTAAVVITASTWNADGKMGAEEIRLVWIDDEYLKDGWLSNRKWSHQDWYATQADALEAYAIAEEEYAARCTEMAKRVREYLKGMS